MQEALPIIATITVNALIVVGVVNPDSINP